MFNDDHDDKPKRAKGYTVGDDLSKFSVEELNKIITELREEIKRLEFERNKKNNSLSEAENVFSKLK